MMTYISNFLDTVAAYLPTILIVLVVLSILLILILVITTAIAFKKAKAAKAAAPIKKAELKKTEPAKTEKLPPIGGRVSERLTLRGFFRASSLSLSFLRAIQFLRQTIDTIDFKYRHPWFLMLGATQSGKSKFLESSGVQLPVDADSSVNKNAEKSGCRWWFFERAVVLDLKGRYFIEEKEAAADEKGWRSLLALLARYRSKRPIDGIILTIPASEIYGPDRVSSDDLSRRSKFMAQKLQAAQHSLGLQIPVYVVVTKCDFIAGFKSFCRGIPVAGRHSMLGWSSPYNLATAYTTQWMTEAFQFIQTTLRHLRMELFAEAKLDVHKDGIFVFPEELVRLQKPLTEYMTSIFKGSTYRESLTLRGLYFTGDSGYTLDALMQKISQKDHSAPEKKEKIKVRTAALAEEVKAEDALSKKVTEFPKAASKAPKPKEDPKPQPESETRTDRALGKVFFIHDLLVEKIFRETGLAQPIYHRLISANRSLNIAKIALAVFVVVGTFGLLRSYDHLSENRDYLVPVLSRINNVLRQLDMVQSGGEPQIMVTQFDDSAKKLLLMMDKVHDTSFSSIFMPPSWVSPLHDKLRNALRYSYERIIIRTLHMDLLHKMREVLTMRPSMQDKSGSINMLLHPTKSPEYLLLEKYVDRLVELKTFVDKYNDLDRFGSPEMLGELVQYSFNVPLPKEFVRQYHNYQNLISSIDYPKIKLALYQEMAQDTLQILYLHFTNALFSGANKNALLGRIHLVLKQFEGKSGQRIPKISRLRKFAASLTKGVQTLGVGGKTWLDAAYFDPGGGFAALMAKVHSFPYFGSITIDQLATQTAVSYNTFQQELSKLNHLLIAHPVLPTKKAKHASDGLLKMEKSLKLLFDEPFMAPSKGAMFQTVIPHAKVVYWDGKLIQMAVDLSQRYEDFMAKQLKNFPPVLQEVLQLTARHSLQMNILDMIARAQTFIDAPRGVSSSVVSEDILRSKISDTKEVVPKFLKLLEILDEERLGHAFIELRNLLGRLSMKLLEQVEEVFVDYHPYTVRNKNFNWWTGQPGASLKAFGVKDLEDLQAYLDHQRDRITHWANEFAKPLVIFLTSDIMKSAEVNRKLINRWKRILEQVDLFEKKRPENSISALETFIMTTMNTANMQTCFTTIPVFEIKGQSGDFFKNRLIQLKRGVRSRCEVTKRQKAIQNYDRLAKFFNTQFKGRFPFVASNLTQNSGEVEPADIRRFYKLYKRYGDKPEVILNQVYQLGDSAVSALKFLASMDKVRSFFKSFLGVHPDNDVPTFDLSVDFHVNREREQNANTIIELSLKPDPSSKIQSFDDKRVGRWKYGEPIEVEFRWADTADQRPLRDPNQSFMSIDGLTARFTYQGQWALLWLLRQQAAPRMDLNTMVETLPKVLKFEMPLGGGQKSVVYMRVTAREPAVGKAPGRVMYIPDFPLQAPQLSDKVRELSKKPVLSMGLVEDMTKNELSSALAGDQNKEEEDLEQQLDQAPPEEKSAEEGTADVDPSFKPGGTDIEEGPV